VAAVGVDKVSKALNLTVRRVQQLAQDPTFPAREGRGKYDLGQCMLWYIRYLQNCIEKRDAPNQDVIGNSLRTERQRLISAQADREELELAKMRAELIPLSLFEQLMSKHITGARQRLLTLPSNVAHLLEAESRDVIKVRLTAEIKNILSSMGGQDEHKAGSTGKPSGDRSATAKTLGTSAVNDGKRVGRHKPRTT
jgi:phage terminase Nu1 subunit (DNA packaging protein)